MTTRQLLRSLIRQVVDEISQGDSAPLENEAVRLVRLMLRRYGLPRLLERSVLQDAVREAQPLLNRFSSGYDQAAFARIAARTSADVATVANSAEATIVREVRSAFARSGGPSTADLMRALRPIEQRTRAQAFTISNTAAAAYDRAARFHDAAAAGVERFRYAGPPADRLFCLLRLKEAKQGMTFTLDQIRQMTNGQGLPVELYCGGFNCRHQWLPVTEVEAPPKRTEPAPPPIAPLRTGAPRPSGPAVSAVLDGPSRGELHGWLGRTMRAIDGVHGDGVLPRLPVIRGRSQQHFGAFFSNRSVDGKHVVIKITLDIPEHPEMTLAHEIGHFLDQQGIPGSAGHLGMASRDPRPDNPMLAWSRVVAQTAEYQAGLEKLQNVTSGRERRLLDYYMSWHELWARSYAQYIAVRSRDERMLEQLNKLRTGPYAFKQWSDDEFEPVARAIDDLFETLGWISRK